MEALNDGPSIAFLRWTKYFDVSAGRARYFLWRLVGHGGARLRRKVARRGISCVHRVWTHEEMRHIQADVKVSYRSLLSLLVPCLKGFGMRPTEP
jgi:hypothetical protein